MTGPFEMGEATGLFRTSINVFWPGSKAHKPSDNQSDHFVVQLWPVLRNIRIK